MSFRLPFMSAKMWCIVGAVIIGLLVLYWVFAPSSSSFEGMEAADSKGTAEIMVFSTTWCPHCQKFKPIWEKIKADNDGKVVNGYTLKMTEIDCTNDDEETTMLMSKYDVNGFPTIKLVKPDGSVVNFDAKPSEESLTQFIQDSLN
jgi:thiol-disulfide isomerase/thioredoxin